MIIKREPSQGEELKPEKEGSCTGVPVDPSEKEA